MYSSNCCLLTCIQISQEAGKLVWYSHLLKNFPQFVVIYTVKGFGIVNKAEVDVFLGLSCFGKQVHCHMSHHGNPHQKWYGVIRSIDGVRKIIRQHTHRGVKPQQGLNLKFTCTVEMTCNRNYP